MVKLSSQEQITSCLAVFRRDRTRKRRISKTPWQYSLRGCNIHISDGHAGIWPLAHGRGGPALGRRRPLLASPVSPASELGIDRHLRRTALRTRLRASTLAQAHRRTGRRRVVPSTPIQSSLREAQARTRLVAARQPRGASRRAWPPSASKAHGALNGSAGGHARPRPPPHRPPTSRPEHAQRHWHRPALGRRLLASPAASANEPGLDRYLRRMALSMDCSAPCDKQRHARDENRERQQRRKTVCASRRGHSLGAAWATMDRPSGYSSTMDPSHHPGSSGARPGAVLRCLTVRGGWGSE